MDTPGDTLERVRIDSLPANGLLFLDGVAVTTAGVEVTGAQLDAGRLSYQPGLDSYGLPLTTFKFSVNDGDVYSSVSATFEIHVTPVNDDPRGTGGTFSTSEDVLLSVDLSSPENLLSNISDVEGDHLTVTTTPISGPANGTLLLNSDGTFSYQPDSEFHGSDSFMYEVVDGNGGSIVATATITITAVNDDPVLSDPGVVLVPENTSQVVTLAATDVDGDLPAYAIAGTGADDALFAVVGNELVFVAAPDFENPLGSGGNTYFVDVIVDDGHSGLDVLTIEIVVVDVMDNPVGIDESFSVDEGGLYTCTTSVLGNDLDRLGQGLTASILVLPSHGIVNMNPDGTFGYQHDGSETTSDLFLYAVIGADGQQDTAEVTVHVNPIQDPTIVNDDGIFVIEPDQAVVITAAELLANDVDPDSTSFQIKLVAGPADGTAYINASGNLVFDPGASFSGVEVLEYVVIADGVTSKPAKVTFDVLPPSSGVPPVEVVVPEEDAAGSEMVVGDTPPPTDEGSVSEPTVNSPSLTSFADPTADTVQSESSQSETDLNESIFELEQQQTTYAYAYDTNILSLENAVGIGRLTTAANGMALSTFDQVMAGIFWSELDSVKQEFLMKFDLTTPTIVASVTSFLTVGYLAWIIRGGVLLTTFMSSVPAWQAFDPLPVIESASGKEDEDDQSIAQMIDKQ
jgi:VCBS repeat-containing protein